MPEKNPKFIDMGDKEELIKLAEKELREWTEFLDRLTERKDIEI